MKQINKKWIYFIIIIFLCLPYTSKGELHGKVELGYVPEIEGFESILNVEYIPWSFVSIYGGIATLMKFNGHWRFGPYRNTYLIGLQLRYKNLYFDMRHACTHGVISVIKYTEEGGEFYDGAQSGNKTKFSVGITW